MKIGKNKKVIDKYKPLIKYKFGGSKMEIKLKIKEFEKLRILNGYTQVSLAEKIGISRQSINTYVLGKQVPGVIVAHKICAVLKCKFTDLFEFIEK